MSTLVRFILVAGLLIFGASCGDGADRSRDEVCGACVLEAARTTCNAAYDVCSAVPDSGTRSECYDEVEDICEND